MNTPQVVVLAIDDNEDIFPVIVGALAQDGVEVLTASDPEEGLKVIRRRHPDIVLLDLLMPKMGGFEVLDRIIEEDPDTDVILMTGGGGTDTAVAAIQKGACDFLQKPIPVAVLREKTRKLIEEAQRRRQLYQLDRDLLANFNFHGVVSRSPLMISVFNRVRRVGPFFRTALIQGATGTGKELIARALHESGQHAGGPFVVVNCAALVDTLFESQLFGYVKGAFTGATENRPGYFEHAHGGTLFLDEIGELPLATQAKLLRVLQTQQVQRVGSPVPHQLDIRVIAATNRDLRAMAAERTFREDLYYRLSMVELKLPRLTERREDLPLLYRHFVEKAAAAYSKSVRSIARRAQVVLNKHVWPGNVRELENVIGHAAMMSEGDLIDVQDLPDYLRDRKPAEDAVMVSMDEMQRRHATVVVEALGGNKARAAEVLGISRGTLYKLLGDADASQPA